MRRITLAALILGLAMLLGYAWLTTSNAAMLDLSTASRLPGSGLVGGTIWWP
jgi:hypothetical protein